MDIYIYEIQYAETFIRYIVTHYAMCIYIYIYTILRDNVMCVCVHIFVYPSAYRADGLPTELRCQPAVPEL